MSDLKLGREAYAQDAWGDAFDRLMASDRQAPLDADDLELAATAAYLTGRHGDSMELWTRAHHDFLARGQARAAFWRHLWDTVTSSNPIAAGLVGGLSDAQRNEVRYVLDGMLRERSGAAGGVLRNAVNIGIGRKRNTTVRRPVNWTSALGCQRDPLC